MFGKSNLKFKKKLSIKNNIRLINYNEWEGQN